MIRYGLIGQHLGHSFSKLVHERIGEYAYGLQEISPEDLPAFLRAAEFEALNVTIPYKQAVIPFLDEVSAEVKAIGACNTIVKRDGRLYGYNTDYYGLRDLILRTGIEVKGRRALVLGTGGTSLTAVKLLADLGAAAVTRVSRRPSEAPDITTYDRLPALASEVEVVVNTTPCGMYPNTGDSPLDLRLFTALEGVIDVIYNPIRSRLVEQALSMGIKAAGGLFMLVGQAVYANALFASHEVYTPLVETIYGELLRQKENIVLIGMPSSGKTTVGRLVAERVGRPFRDSDEEIVRREGRSISEIFAERGEAAFRCLEREVIAEWSASASQVIATGGGVVLDEANIRALRRNGRLFFLDRRLDLLCPTADRPLSSHADDMAQRYRERLPLYRQAADVLIDGNGSPEETANVLIDNFMKV